MDLKCLGCDTPIPSGASNCPMCGAMIRFETETCEMKSTNLHSVGLSKSKRSINTEIPKKEAVRIIIGVIVGFCLFAYFQVKHEKNKEIPLTAEYEESWQGEINIDISRSLVANHISCSEYRYKSSLEHSGEYLVECTSDGVVWRKYIIWAPIKKAIGPLK